MEDHKVSKSYRPTGRPTSPRRPGVSGLILDCAAWLDDLADQGGALCDWVAFKPKRIFVLAALLAAAVSLGFIWGSCRPVSIPSRSQVPPVGTSGWTL